MVLGPFANNQLISKIRLSGNRPLLLLKYRHHLKIFSPRNYLLNLSPDIFP
jgi:hypothetical protein